MRRGESSVRQYIRLPTYLIKRERGVGVVGHIVRSGDPGLDIAGIFGFIMRPKPLIVIFARKPGIVSSVRHVYNT